MKNQMLLLNNFGKVDIESFSLGNKKDLTRRVYFVNENTRIFVCKN